MPRNRLEPLARLWVPGAGAVQIEPLDSGLVNVSCRVVRAGRAYVLRIAAPQAPGQSLDRDWERRVLLNAAAGGVAPVICSCEPAAGILVTEWVPGRVWTAAEIRGGDAVTAMSSLLRRVHALPIPRPARTMRPADLIARYSAELARVPRRSRLGVDDLRAAAELRATVLAAGATPVLCHSDLHRLNVVVGERTVVLDWEYAHVTDPYWDLAGWVANNDAGEEFALRLLHGYLERPATPPEAARLLGWVWLYDYVCLLWSELYLSQRSGDAADGVSARADRLSLRLREVL